MKLNIGTSRFTQVTILDAPGHGNAHHSYEITQAEQENNPPQVFAFVRFQNGPIKEAGVNGMFNEDLLAIVIHRLQCFQSGPYQCRENALALTKLEEAMHWLNARTTNRQARGVEGTHKI